MRPQERAIEERHNTAEMLSRLRLTLMRPCQCGRRARRAIGGSDGLQPYCDLCARNHRVDRQMERLRRDAANRGRR